MPQTKSFKSRRCGSESYTRLAHHLSAPPILRLPTELLANILELGTFSCIDQDDFSQVPVRLSQICSRMRAVALSTGSLWTKIVLAFPYTSEDLFALAVRLARSKNCPLDIFLDMRDPDWDWDWDTNEQSHGFTAKHMETLLMFLLPQAHRWRSFELLTDTWSPIHAFLWHSQAALSVPQLQTLRLSRCNAYFASKGQAFEPKALQSPVPLFGGKCLPNLRALSLSGVHVDWASLNAPALESLELKFHSFNVMPTFSVFSSLMERLSSLDNLTMLGWGPQLDDKDANPDSNLCLPNVSKLTIGLLDVAYSQRLLSILSFPKLADLHLEDLSAVISPEDRVNTTSLVDFLADSGASNSSPTSDHDRRDRHSPPVFPLNLLKSLCLHGLICDGASLRRLFYTLSSLEDLNLISVENNTFRSLLPCPKGSDIPPGTDKNLVLPCPALHRLSCRSVDILSLSGIVGLRKSMDPTQPLDELTFSVRDSSSWGAIRHLHSALAGLGIEFQISIFDQ